MASQAAVSIIMPVHNGSLWLKECLASVSQQTYSGKIELSVYDDASTDDSRKLIEKWARLCDDPRISLIISGHEGLPYGVGYAKNQAIAQSSGEFLCFLDSDDVMHEDRIVRQLEVAVVFHRAIVGCKFHREPQGSTARFTQWANTLTQDQLYTQVYLSHGPTVIMPTWFCHRDVITSLGGFDERGKGTPEDLLLFYKHLENGGEVIKVDLDLLMYRYHPQAETFSIAENTIWTARVEFLEKQVLNKLKSFSIWNAGKQGRKFYRSLSPYNKKKVLMFCDVDIKKIEQKKFYIDESSKEVPRPKIPIVHFTEVRPPVIICVKMNLSGNFEQNLKSLRLKEGRDYLHFN
ncbi:UDP-GlcNAc:betaGal beta-1,3-N-acetylglucosaminyltransferase-like protein 1 isoform X1 [Biomphalaria glabrata]|uniref:UDP-GlcNAc:betaGal beta-1,3-N-acetylglucosaminyltransferase-like protein 1 isoform X1 n=2 Tax=Biomphalaria glabrata TaxID=6526 RepID=A0A9W2ZSD4_BIOGL|nr:UDP-GlcNAc:betaGal beta-1,3-N-acetylglucosaminyltransferase-like protein 1 isoform X1 [Biomphalaria glabrata]